MESLDVEEEADDVENVVVGREGRQPTDCQIPHPHHQDQGVDRKEAHHRQQDRERVVVAIPETFRRSRGGGRGDVLGEEEGADGREEVDEEDNEEGELEGSEEEDEEKEGAHRHDSLSGESLARLGESVEEGG